MDAARAVIAAVRGVAVSVAGGGGGFGVECGDRVVVLEGEPVA
jgi:hypothetical protein